MTAGEGAGWIVEAKGESSMLEEARNMRPEEQGAALTIRAQPVPPGSTLAQPAVEPVILPASVPGSACEIVPGGSAPAGRHAHAPGISSMTGYARVSARTGDAPALTLTLKSINHRFLDLQLRLPAGAEALEPSIRAELKRALARGHVECTLTLDRVPRKENVERRTVATHFDLAALRSYVESFRAAAAELGLRSEPDLNTAARLPGMLLAAPDLHEEAVMAGQTAIVASAQDGSTGDATAQDASTTDAMLIREVPALLGEALVALKVMRNREGAALALILRDSLFRLALMADEVGTLRSGVQEAHFTRLAERLDALVGRAFDRDRVLAEAALLAERGDVEEELARMHTHIAHFRTLLDGGGEAGKKLDFLLQEMNREANTLLSKTAGMTGGSARITECGLAMKAEIEKLREQVQNLE